MGFLLSSLALLMLYGAIQLYRMCVNYSTRRLASGEKRLALTCFSARTRRFFKDDWSSLYAAVAGYGLGAHAAARQGGMSSLQTSAC